MARDEGKASDCTAVPDSPWGVAAVPPIISAVKQRLFENAGLKTVGHFHNQIENGIAFVVYQGNGLGRRSVRHGMYFRVQGEFFSTACHKSKSSLTHIVSRCL